MNQPTTPYGYQTGYWSVELRNPLVHWKNQLTIKHDNSLNDHLTQLLDKVLGHVAEGLKEFDPDHFLGNDVLADLVENCEEWHYPTTGSDTAFYSAVIPGPRAAVGHWSVYAASLHGIEGYDFSITVRDVTPKIVEDVNYAILNVLPKEGHVLIDAISTPGFTGDTFVLEGRRVDLSVEEWGIRFLFYEHPTSS